MTFEPASSHPFDPDSGDPDSGSLPDGLAALGGEAAGRVVVLAVGEGADPEWAARSAVALARRWARDASRLFLMDLGLEAPSLHGPLELPNEEGATDVFLYGSSVQHVARPADGGAFFFASAGTPTADIRGVLAHERWAALLKGFRDASATVLLYLPLDAPGADEVLGRADRIVVLDVGEGDARAVVGREERVVGELVEPGRSSEDVQEVETEEETEPPLVDVADLAPDEDAAGVVEIGDLAPDAEATRIVAIAELAPDAEAESDEAAPAVAGPGDEVGEAMEEAAAFGDDLALDEEPAADEAVSDDARDGAVEEEIEEEIDEELGEEGEDDGTGPGESEPSGLEGPVMEVADLAPEPDETSPDPGGEVGDAMDEAATFDDDFALDDEPPVDDEPAVDREIGAVDEEEIEAVHEEEEEDEDLGADDAFDMASFDTLGDEPDGGEDEGDGEIRVRADFGEEPDDDGDEPEEPDAVTLDDPEAGEGDVDGSDFGGFSQEVETEEGEDEPSDEDGDDAFDFGGFSGEMELEEEEDEEGEEEPAGQAGGPQDGGPGPGPPASGGEGEAGEPGFGEDLVTGPDFGQGAPDDDWDLEEEEPEEEGPDADDRRPHPAEASADEVPGGAGGDPRERAAAGRRGEEATDEDGEAGGSDEEAQERRGETPSPSRSVPERLVRLVGALLVVAAGAFALHWLGLVRIPGADRVIVQVLGPAAAGSVPEVVAGDPPPETGIMGYSLALDAYRESDAASEVADAWQASYDGFLFFVAPVDVDEDLFHRLLAGPAETASEAEELREALAGVLTREDPSNWVVRSTPLAFLVSEHESVQAAETRVGQLARQEIPAYVLRVTYPGDTVRHRVYVGAYESGEEARAMQGILSSLGVEDVRFTERRGVLPE